VHGLQRPRRLRVRTRVREPIVLPE
jgi:hypothetical protein